MQARQRIVFYYKCMESLVAEKVYHFCSVYYQPTLYRNIQMRFLMYRKGGTLQARYPL